MYHAVQLDLMLCALREVLAALLILQLVVTFIISVVGSKWADHHWSHNHKPNKWTTCFRLKLTHRLPRRLLHQKVRWKEVTYPNPRSWSWFLVRPPRSTTGSSCGCCTAACSRLSVVAEPSEWSWSASATPKTERSSCALKLCWTTWMCWILPCWSLSWILTRILWQTYFRNY